MSAIGTEENEHADEPIRSQLGLKIGCSDLELGLVVVLPSTSSWTENLLAQKLLLEPLSHQEGSSFTLRPEAGIEIGHLAPRLRAPAWASDGPPEAGRRIIYLALRLYVPARAQGGRLR